MGVRITYDDQMRPVVQATEEPGDGGGRAPLAQALDGVSPRVRAQIEELLAEGEKAPLGQQGFISGLSDFRIAGVPIGLGLVGGTAATLISEVVEGLVPAERGDVLAAVVKLAAGGALAGPLSGFLGRQAAEVAMTFLAFDAARDLIPLDDWVRNLVARFRPAPQSQVLRQLDAAPAMDGAGKLADLEDWLASR